MSRIVFLFLFVALASASARAEDTAYVRYSYPTASIFAFQGSTCPNGSNPISDPIYIDAGRLSNVVYCLFPSPEFTVAPGAPCPSRFEKIAKDRCLDKRGRR